MHKPERTSLMVFFYIFLKKKTFFERKQFIPEWVKCHLGGEEGKQSINNNYVELCVSKFITFPSIKVVVVVGGIIRER